MKKITVITLLFFVIGLTAQAQTKVKNFKLEQQDGSEFSFESLKGKYVLIDFWASWCAPCHAKLPELHQVYKELEGRNFEIVGISIDRKRASWERDLDKLKLPWIQLIDKQGAESVAMGQFKITGVPTTYLISPVGQIIKMNPSMEEVKNTILK